MPFLEDKVFCIKTSAVTAFKEAKTSIKFLLIFFQKEIMDAFYRNNISEVSEIQLKLSV